MVAPRVPAPGMAVAAGLVGAAFACDYWLIRRGHLTVSSCVRGSRVARAAALGLALHLWRSWRYDPITALGRHVELRIQARSSDLAQVPV